MTILNKYTSRIIIFVTLLFILLPAIWLRRQFIHTVQLYPDEFVTLLAIRMIGQTGVPVMPSGLFYEHGLLYSYLGSVAAVFGPVQLAARYLSLLLGIITILLTFWVGRRWFSPAVGVIAAAGLAVAPSAIQWSGRARMYALVQLLVLATLWPAYEGITQNKAWLRWLALLAYLGAVLAHFGAVAVAPPLVLAALILWWQTARKNGAPLFGYIRNWRWWLESAACAGVLAIAFLVKRAGQPKGIEALEGSASAAVAGIAQVFEIYSDFSFNLVAGWQAISPFYFGQPALLFALFALPAIILSAIAFLRQFRNGTLKINLGITVRPALFLSIILLVTTLEMILLVSPHRRDEKYLFMLLPVLLVLGAEGLAGAGRLLLRVVAQEGKPRSLRPLLPSLTAALVSIFVVSISWPQVQALLKNTGDDYQSAFATVQAQWQKGDAILTGTPAAAVFYLNRNDFYSVQRRGGYDYRILTVDDQAVDRWLASPAIQTGEALHQILAQQNVWLVLERWGLQREYYDLPFQQQLLAQTDHVSDSQGIFILKSKPNPRPIALYPARPAQAAFGNTVQLLGYTAEPEKAVSGQPLRLTLYWQALARVACDYTVFVHLRQAGGGNVAQADHRPLGSIYPTSLWPVGETIRESSELFLPADLPPGDYELWAGLYLLETGERLPVQNDTSGENAVKLGTLPVTNNE